MSNLVMYDAITQSVSQMPTDGDIYAGYDDGSFNDVGAIIARFPDKPVVSIDVLAANQAQCLDVETGDAKVSDIDPWLANFALTGPVFDLPIIYMSVDLARSAFPTKHPNGCLLWSAHYTGTTPHICGPNTCGRLPYNADMTQWESTNTYDKSSVNPAHFIWKGNQMSTQAGWAYCRNCKTLFFLANGGPCLAKPTVTVTGTSVDLTFGQHDGTTSLNYVLTTQ